MRAARKWPVETDIEDVESSKRARKEPEMAESEVEKEVEDEHMEDVDKTPEKQPEPVQKLIKESAKDQSEDTPKPTATDTTTPDISKSKWTARKANSHTHHNQRAHPPDQHKPTPLPPRSNRPLPPRAYQPTDSFHTLKKHILSNAYAYYAHRYRKAEQLDLITSSNIPHNLSSTQWRAALIVYPDPGKKEWKVLYKSNVCPTVEDAAFEMQFWLEEDMWGVLEEVKEGESWSAEKSRGLEAKETKMKAQAQAAERKNKEKRQADERKGKDTTKD